MITFFDFVGVMFIIYQIKLKMLNIVLHCFSMKMYSNRRKEKLNLIKKELELESKLDNIE